MENGAEAARPQKSAEELAWQERCEAGKRAFAQARYGEAAKDYEEALRQIESFGFNDPRFRSTLNLLAAAYAAEGRFDDAEQVYGHVLTLRRAAFGRASAQAAQTLNDLGALYAARGKFAEAERAYRESLAASETARGAEDAALCPILNNLALFYKNRNRTEEALPLFERALRIGLKTGASAAPFISASLNNLAAICVERGRHAEAEALLTQSLSIKEKTAGPEHRDVATILNNLGELYCATGRAGEAKSVFERVLRIDEAAWGPDHAEVAADLMRLGDLARDEGRRADAASLYGRAARIRESALGANHPLTVKSRGKFEGVAEQSAPVIEKRSPGGRPASKIAPPDSAVSPEPQAAKAAAQSGEAPRTLAMLAAEPDLTRPGAAQSLCELAERAAAEARWEDAKALYRRELEIERALRGDENACVAATLNNLGLVEQSLSNIKEAAALLQSSLAIWVGLRENRRAAIVLNNLAFCAMDKENAETLYRRSAAFYQGAPGGTAHEREIIESNLAGLRAG